MSEFQTLYVNGTLGVVVSQTPTTVNKVYRSCSRFLETVQRRVIIVRYSRNGRESQAGHQNKPYPSLSIRSINRLYRVDTFTDAIN